MRKITIIFILALASMLAKAQSPSMTIDSLERYINRYIRNSAVEAFTNLRMNTVLINLARYADSAIGAGTLDTAYRAGDSLKIETNTKTFTVYIGGGGGGSLSNAGAGFRVLITNGTQARTLFGSNTVLIDSSSNANGLTFKADTSTLATQYDLTQVSGGAPGGVDEDIQTKNGSLFNGSSGFFTWNNTNKTLSIGRSTATNTNPRIRFNDSIPIGAGTGANGTVFMRIDKIDRTGDYGNTSFYFNNTSSKDLSGAVPNSIVTWGHNLSGGGGLVVAGKHAIGYSLEHTYDPDGNGQNPNPEAHLMYVDSNGFQRRLFSYTINPALLDIDYYHTVSRMYLFNPSLVGTGSIWQNYLAASQNQLTVYGNIPRFTLQDTTNTLYKAEFFQNGQDLNVTSRRNIAFQSSGAYSFNVIGMELNADRLGVNTAINWGSSVGLLNINTTHANNTLFKFQRNGSDIFYTNNSDKLFLAKSSVDSTAAVGGYYLYIDSTTNQIKRAIAAATGGGGGGISGSGTSGRIPKFTASTTIGDGLLRDNGSGIGIGGAAVADNMLDVQGGNSRFDMYDAGVKYGELSIRTPSATSNMLVQLNNVSGGGTARWTMYRSASTDRFAFDINTGTGEIKEEYGAGGYFKTVSMNGTEAYRVTAAAESLFGSSTDNGAYKVQITGGLYQSGNFKLDLGSDANWDTYTRNSGGLFQRIPNGTTGQAYIATASAAPSWGTLGVVGGGTGLTTTTAYGIIAGGTTSTGNFQNIGTGTAGQRLKSNGAAALPTWVDTIPMADFTEGTTNSLTFTYVSNTSATSTVELAYYRSGNNIHCYGKVTVVSTASGAWQLDMAFPIASAVTADYMGGGTGYCAAKNETMGISVDGTNDRFVMKGTASDGASREFTFSCSYRYIAP